MENKKRKMSFKRIIAVVVGILVACIIGLSLSNYIKDKVDIKLVQNGFMGDYNTVTTKEVMEDFPKDKGTQKWEVDTNEINGERRTLVSYSFNGDSMIKFLLSKDKKTYDVFYMELNDEEIKSDEFSYYMFFIYVDFTGKYPNKGVNALNDNGNTNIGTSEEIRAIKNNQLYDTDMCDYIDKLCFKSTIDKLDLEETESDADKYTYKSKERNLSIYLKDENTEEYNENDDVITVGMSIEGSRNMSPSFYGVRLGDDIESVREEIVSNGYESTFNEYEEDERVSYYEFTGKDGSYISIGYRVKTNNIFYIYYGKNIKISELDENAEH